MAEAGGGREGSGVTSVAVHPVTSYVINYLRQFQDRAQPGCYGCILEEALREVDPAASLNAETDGLLALLQANVEARSHGCPSELLRAIFLVNNMFYVASFAATNNLPSTEALHRALQGYCDMFEGHALKGLLVCLGSGDSSNMDTNEVTKRLKVFNAAFEELALEQKDWAFVNDECRRKMRMRLAASVKTRYSKFLLPHREDLCTMPTYHWAPDGVERLMQKSFLLNCSLVPFSFTV
eukprot:TRINITY_DN16410_c0_g1_i2.p1 TRINITY_DN16410_c0_g1~~TRINITY_DN16410_c0_g1_i2.p1  ORF type:complete len:262 (+),score=16.77 TRINITY_DN16410_c0_g1_i2:74-787(+)